MATIGKSFSVSVALHVAVVIGAAAFVVHNPGGQGTGVETEEPWGSLVAEETAGEFPVSDSNDEPADALPPEPVAESQPSPSPTLPPVEIAPATRDPIAATGPTSAPTIEPPATVAKKTARKTSRGTAAARGGSAAGSAGPAGVGGGGAYRPARYADCPAPLFPAEARKAKIFGTVLLLVQVDEKGRPLEVAVRHSSGHDVLDSAALRAVRRWRFEPARLGERNVSARLEIPVRFAAS